MKRLSSNHTIYFAGLLIALIGSILLGRLFAGDLINHVRQDTSFLEYVRSITLLHWAIMLVGGLLIVVFLLGVHIYSDRVDLVTDILTFIGGALIVIASAMFQLLEMIAARLAPLAERWMVYQMLTFQFIGWLMVCLVMVDFVICLTLYVYGIKNDTHVVHSALEEMRLAGRLLQFVFGLIREAINKIAPHASSSKKPTIDTAAMQPNVE